MTKTASLDDFPAAWQLSVKRAAHSSLYLALDTCAETAEGPMPFTSQDIHPLARQLHAQLPYKAWPRGIGLWEEFTQVADDLRATCRQADVEEPQATIIAEALAGLVYHWGSRYRRLDGEIARATDVLVTAIGGSLHAPGMYALRHGTPITIASIAHLIGWVTILEVEEP
jgi:hypothetical protein